MYFFVTYARKVRNLKQLNYLRSANKVTKDPGTNKVDTETPDITKYQDKLHL